MVRWWPANYGCSMAVVIVDGCARRLAAKLAWKLAANPLAEQLGIGTDLGLSNGKATINPMRDATAQEAVCVVIGHGVGGRGRGELRIPSGLGFFYPGDTALIGRSSGG
jgi:hypothetical protein